MSNKKFQKAVVMTMIGIMLISTVMFGLSIILS
ncbi:MAG: stressosome-associated protein Prli42 [Kurthia gibsonii]|uniref:Stressosome-associated protein Prli42 n=1 Tax=Kurthia gibsonii TaxID=33946 RepID=A0ABU9LLX8_9BACL|nr:MULTISPECIES: stressosome-associated protein Prli42 [Kurthia]MCA9725584.1 stressosome-associated protein Prli42 [Kurthia sp.]WIL37396.1 stressosome-associated protein Prli42 [Kurthia sp. YJT4]HZG12618.1 stressosome-associated protein Prli42 [Kurthia gibsonii]